MRKHLLRTLAVVSLLLMTLAIAVTIHGYRAWDGFGYFGNRWTGDNHLILDRYCVAANHGQFQFRAVTIEENWSLLEHSKNGRENGLAALAKMHRENPEFAGWEFRTKSYPATIDADLLKKSLIGFNRLLEPTFSTGGCVAVPAWLPILLLALLPAYHLFPQHRKSSPPNATPAGLALA